ncbi:predicted protein [Arabidopsis lyrata subsp. lyrata]|uniref:Predicted protein n=1 Tax=Arabidopsis lyrata subsp. lyrata TaxID=81972 RepID=D7LJL0_ARALL|nr:predicted protein [Arabidopsis lyrata subsp. lyrata]
MKFYGQKKKKVSTEKKQTKQNKNSDAEVEVEVEDTKYPCLTTMAWENLEKGRLMGFRVFTRGIWYTLTIFSIFGLLKSGSEVLFTPIRFGVTTLFTVMLLKCLFYDDGYPDPTKMPVLKHLRFLTSLIILPVMFYIPFYYPTMDVLVSTFSLLAGGVSIYQLSSTIDIGHGLIILFLAFTNGLLAIDLATHDYDDPCLGVLSISFFQYIVYVYNFEFLANVV